MNENKFFTLFMGECWHELIPYCDVKGMFKCKICGIEKSIAEFWNPNPDHFANPYPVIRWMEENMPEVWSAYVDAQFILFRYDKKEAYECLNKALKLNNLIAYLNEHREWGVKECKDIGTKGIRTCICGDRPDKEYCNGTGIIKHPALIYLEQGEDCKFPTVKKEGKDDKP